MHKKTMRVLGIDPGSRRTGYGVCDFSNSEIQYVCSGVIKLPSSDIPNRLKIIFQEVTQIIEGYKPTHMAIEEVFFAKDPRAALKLGQARGAAIVAGTMLGLSIGEYSPKRVKQAVVGTGSADKNQVQMMVMHLLSLTGKPSEDAADALAIAICHCHSIANQSLCR